MWSAHLRRAGELLRHAQAAVALTGAGISTPSGIPDFRSPVSGLWDQSDPFEVASLTVFRYHPEKFYRWFRSLAIRFYEASPNPAHVALAALEQAGLLKLLITQNIDELHRRAGSERVLEVHGSIHEAVCGTCHQTMLARPALEQFVKDGAIPRCPTCGGILKPSVILMGEQLPDAVFRRARAACRQSDVMLIVGSSLEVLPAAGLPLEALAHGAKLIIINLGTTYLDHRADVLIHADVAEVLPQLAEEAGITLHD